MMATSDDLTKMHDLWLQEFDAFVKRNGGDADNAAEAMLTVCTVAMMSIHGPRHVAARLAVVAGMLTAAANEAAVDGRSDEKTRH
jgi:hypothetical protein